MSLSDYLNHIETDEFIIFSNVKYDDHLVSKCRNSFDIQKMEGRIKGDFDDVKWMAYTDLKWVGIKFDLNEFKYMRHFYKQYNIPYKKMILMLKCYAMYYQNELIFLSVASNKVQRIISFMEMFGDGENIVSTYDVQAITDFLLFISTPIEEIEEIKESLSIKKEKDYSNRTLSPAINYFAIQREVDRLFDSSIDDELYVKWFPIWFWVHITFNLPLRATEMMVTPFNCVGIKNGRCSITVRRTNLKGSKRKIVYRDVDKDYRLCSYDIVSERVIAKIQKYCELTKYHKRRFLFDYPETNVNEWFSPEAFNRLLWEFIDEYLVGNAKYDFARKATGIEEFEHVTAGDSRPIAIVNLVNSGFSVDTVMDLAGHSKVETTAGYYTNISQIIQAESVMQLIDEAEKNHDEYFNRVELKHLLTGLNTKGFCDCEKLDEKPANCPEDEKHGKECMGCSHYFFTKEALDEYVEEYKKRFDNSAQLLIQMLNKILKAKEIDKTIEEYLLETQHNAALLKIGMDYQVMEMYKEWERS